MRNGKTVTVIVAVVIVASAFAGVWYVASNQDTKSDDFTLKGLLLAYGNANNDNYLDENDLDLVKDIADGNIQWDRVNHPLADANTDGNVDQEDVKLIRKFLGNEEAIMYYRDWNLGVSSVHFPLKGNIACYGPPTLDMGVIVGFFDRVTHMLQLQKSIDGLRKDLYPGAAERIKSVGSSTYDYEVVAKSGVKAVIGYPGNFTESFINSSKVTEAFDCILLPEDISIRGITWNHTIVTLGVMMGLQSNTSKYLDYLTDVSAKIERFSESVGEKLSCVIANNPKSPVAVNLEMNGKPSTSGIVHNMQTLPMRSLHLVEGNSGWASNVEIETILKANPSVVIITTWGYTPEGTTVADYQRTIDTMGSYFKGCDAYENGRVIGVTYEMYGAVNGISGLLLLMSMLWDGSVGSDEGWEAIQDYYDRFTLFKGDVRDAAGFFPLTAAKA